MVYLHASPEGGMASPDGDWDAVAEAAMGLGRRGETREALAMLQHALESARSQRDAAGEIVLLNGAALMHSIRGDFWSSLASSMDAFTLAERARDRRGMAHAMTMLAGAMLLMTPIDSEIALLRHALAIAEEQGDMRLQVRIHNLLGILLGDLHRFDQAEVHLDLAQVLAECGKEGPAVFDRWRVMANLANLQRKRAEAAHRMGLAIEVEERAASGLELIGRVEIHCVEHGKVPILLDALRVSAMLLAVTGRDDLANAKFDAAWKLAVEKRQRSALPGLGVDIGRRRLKAGRLDAADLVLTEALREAEVNRPSPKAAPLCLLAADIARARGDATADARWRRDAAVAQGEFESLQRDARKQLARVSERLALSQGAAMASQGR